MKKYSWNFYINYNIDFLTGRKKDTFYHGPLEEETFPLLNKLIRINNYGFFSTSGQPGEIVKGFTKNTWISNGKKMGNWYYEIVKKSYISGIAENNEITKKLKRFLKDHPEVYVRWTNGLTDSMAKNRFYSNFPDDRYNVTKQRHKKKFSNTWSKWDFYTNIDIRYHKDLIYADHTTLAQGVFFDIAMKEYNTERTVEDVLLDFYENI